MLARGTLRLRYRIGLIVQIHLLLMIGIVLLFTAHSDGRPGPRRYRLPEPEKVALITAAFEHAPPQTHAGLVRAFSDPNQRVTLLPELPRPSADVATPATIDRYRDALAGRPFRITAKSLNRPFIGSPRAFSPQPIRVAVALSDGHAVSVEQMVVAPITRILDNLTLFMLVVAAIDLAVILWLAAQTTRPVERLARAVREDRLETLRQGGPREIAELGAAFRQLRARLRDLLDERTRMLAAIAHDYRTYLTRLQLRIEFIEDEQQRALASGDLAEMQMLLSDTLTFARESVTDGVNGATCALRSELAAIAQERAARGEDVRIDGGGADVRLHASHVSFQRMMANLLDNALRYGGGRAAVRYQRRDEVMRICVEDQGPGVPETSLKRLLEPFERGEPSRSRDTGGVGLGLSIVQALAHRYHGDLVLENRPEGGFRAILTLRVVQPGAAD